MLRRTLASATRCRLNPRSQLLGGYRVTSRARQPALSEEVPLSHQRSAEPELARHGKTGSDNSPTLTGEVNHGFAGGDVLTLAAPSRIDRE